MFGARSPFASVFELLSRFERIRSQAVRAVCRLEGGQMLSPSYRGLMRTLCSVEVGPYSYGPILWPGAVPEGTLVGNYCSIGPRVEIFRRNHPTGRIAMHPFFYNSGLGVISSDSIPMSRDNPLTVEHDVWIGADVIVTPRCKSIGLGSVVGAGAVVTRDVPRFAIVAGNPARIVGTRFNPDVQEVLLESRWWEHPVERLVPKLELFLADATLENARILLASLRCDSPNASEK